MDTMEIIDDRNANNNLTKQGQGNSARCATVCLGLLCAVLLAGNIGQIIYRVRTPKSAEPMQTTERKQLEDGMSNLTKERDQLHQSYDTLKQESDQLKINYDDMQMSLEELQTFLNQLQTYYVLLMMYNDQLQRNYDTLNISKIQPVISSRSLQTIYTMLERGAQQTRFSGLATNSLKIAGQFQDQMDNMLAQIRTMLCQTGWKKFDVSCYFVSTVKKNWTSSRQECIDKGADLTIINSKGEELFINELLKTGNKAWIGLTYSPEEETWMWVDGTSIGTTYWDEGQPDSDGGNQECGVMLATSSEQGGKWKDDGCFAEQIFICEQ